MGAVTDSGRGWGYIILVDREGLFDELAFEQSAKEMKASGYPGKVPQEARTSSAKAYGRKQEKEQRGTPGCLSWGRVWELKKDRV